MTKNQKLSESIGTIKKFIGSKYLRLTREQLYHRAIGKLSDDELHVEIRAVKGAISISTGFYKATYKSEYSLNNLIILVALLLELRENSKKK